MNHLKLKIIGSLLVAVILTVINFEHYLIFIGLFAGYSLFKAMDLYHEVSNVL